MSYDTRVSTSGESWEVIAHSRTHVAARLDEIIENTAACDCGEPPDSVVHYDALSYVANREHPIVTAGLLAEAIARLAADRKAARQ